ncbi:MAG: MCE family protein [Gammaproteobacteria bacterium]|nr:MCE family protein [Gammaproteobacteria bacterium]MCP5197834.1 MCE family protein [Gammaproteobacteria bacterium]
MQSNVNYALVGLFVIILGSALLSVVFWLTLGSESKTYNRYRVYFHESVAGLNLKATVRYRGVEVGQVESIRLDPKNPDQVDVVLGIERSTPIRRDTIATLSTRGLTGVASVELSGGGQALPLEKGPGQDLPVIQAGPSLVARLDDAFNSILTNFDNLSKRLERLLSDENQIALTENLQHLSTITGAVADRSDSLRQTLKNVEVFTNTLAQRAERMGRALDQFATALESTDEISTQFQATLRDVQASAQAVRNAANNMTQTSRAFTELAGDGRRELRQLGQNTVPEIDTLLVQANELMRVLQRLAGMLEENPRALLLGKPQGRPGPGE